MRIALTLACSLVCPGCVSLHWTSESPPADPPSACEMRFEIGEARAREEVFFENRWGEAGAYRLGLVTWKLRQLAAQCAHPPGAPTVPVTAYFRGYTNRPFRALLAVTAPVITGATLGFAPLPREQAYAVCLQGRHPDGRDRIGMASDRLFSIANVWSYHVRCDRYGRHADEGCPSSLQEIRDQHVEMYRAVATKAWNALVMGGNAEVAEGGCPAALDALAQ
jgi:hypothetical protein